MQHYPIYNGSTLDYIAKLHMNDNKLMQIHNIDYKIFSCYNFKLLYDILVKKGIIHTKDDFWEYVDDNMYTIEPFFVELSNFFNDIGIGGGSGNLGFKNIECLNLKNPLTINNRVRSTSRWNMKTYSGLRKNFKDPQSRIIRSIRYEAFRFIKHEAYGGNMYVQRR